MYTDNMAHNNRVFQTYIVLIKVLVYNLVGIIVKNL
jgi:hypothetical protein